MFNRNYIIKLYIGINNKVPTADELGSWENFNGYMYEISKYLINENQSSLSAYDLASSVWSNLFNTEIPSLYANYFESAAESGRLSKENIVTKLINTAWGNNKTVLENKLDLANQFIDKGISDNTGCALDMISIDSLSISDAMNYMDSLFGLETEEESNITFFESEYDTIGETFRYNDSAESFDIELVFDSNASAQNIEIIEAAAARWEEIIVGDVEDHSNWYYGDVDDIKIDINFSISKYSGTLGYSFTHDYYNRDDSEIPWYGYLNFKPNLDEEAMFNVALHEMGHALGINGNLKDMGLLTSDGEYIGENGVNAYQELFETTGPLLFEGTSHIKESQFDNELMTPMMDTGETPVSIVTVGILNDIGYEVNYDAANLFLV